MMPLLGRGRMLRDPDGDVYESCFQNGCQSDADDFHVPADSTRNLGRF